MGDCAPCQNPNFNKPMLSSPISSCTKSLSHSAPLYLYYNEYCGPSIDLTESKIECDSNEFEFDSHRRYSPPSNSGDRQQAFADELFRRGELLPLKLPPRLEPLCVSAKCSQPSSCTTSPTMLVISTLKSPFARVRSHDKGLDPFMVALEKVRKDERVRRDRGSPRQRSRSLSPFRRSIFLWKEDSSVNLPLNEVTTMKISGKNRSKGTFSFWVSIKGIRDLLLFRSKSQEKKKKPFISCGLSPLVCFGFS